uniref:Uncharacterized protein n=1 Tax=Palpitomonas bilix TaxID=652834 RepID=A0A7S3G9T4_9EUKA|mmetsp:Transcript_33701/g.86420  ORF Transcript_33701/g.86420 Transcript_33701/m.86420 type:complete len:150 (+) Transcript_33701:55-504(+)
MQQKQRRFVDGSSSMICLSFVGVVLFMLLSSVRSSSFTLCSQGFFRQDASSRRARSRSRKRSSSRGPMEEEEEDAEKKRKRSASRALSQGAGYRSVKQKVDAEKSAKRVQREFKKSERTAESDRKIAVKRPKHLFSGKRDIRKASTQGR